MLTSQVVWILIISTKFHLASMDQQVLLTNWSDCTFFMASLLHDQLQYHIFKHLCSSCSFSVLWGESRYFPHYVPSSEPRAPNWTADTWGKGAANIPSGNGQGWSYKIKIIYWFWDELHSVIQLQASSHYRSVELPILLVWLCGFK